MKRRTLKSRIILIAALLTSAVSQAQVYQHDYMSYHERTTDVSSDIGNRAIFKDESGASNVYYIAQSDPQRLHTITVSKTDPDLNILTSFDYTSYIIVMVPSPIPGEAPYPTQQPNPDVSFTINDITGIGSDIYVVGSYIHEGVDRGGFILKAGKNGVFKWFKRFNEIFTFNACAPAHGGIVAIGHRTTGTFTDPMTKSSGTIARVNGLGTLLWQHDVEDDKYQGHPFITPNTCNNSLSDVIALEDDLFAAVGQSSDFGVGGAPPAYFPIPDGDGSLVVFRGDGTIVSRFGLGNVNWVQDGGSQPMRHELLRAITRCSDGDVVLVGDVITFVETYFPTHCPGPDPETKGLWVTKINPYTGAIAWSNLYDFYAAAYPGADLYYGAGFVRATNDGADNIGITFFSQFQNTGAAVTGSSYIMKLEPTAGGVVYAREYIYNSNESNFNDITAGFGNTDLVAIGETSPTTFYPGMVLTRDGWNVKAFDNIINQCNQQELNVEPQEHAYDVFNVEVYSKATNNYEEDYLTREPYITTNIVCEKIEVQSRDNKDHLPEPAVVVSQDAGSNTIVVSTQGKDVYSGKLINVQGQTIQTYETIEQVYRIALPDIAPGLYFLQLSSAHSHITKPVLVK